MKLVKIALALSTTIAASAVAQDQPPIDRFAIPTTVSKEAAERLRVGYDMIRAGSKPTKPASVEDWDRNQARAVEFGITLGKPTLEALKASVTEERIGEVPVVRVRLSSWKPSGRALVYIHGGGYTAGSALSTAANAALMASATGLEVVSIDYTVAPRGKWQTVTDEVLAVWQGLLKSGIKPQSIGLFGDSAGGGLVAGAVLKMRDKGMPLPGALCLQSPWSDITATGDTITTLAAAEPLLTNDLLAWSAEAYADLKDQKNPYVSPVYGDYSRAFPPTLIQVGTREIFLSHAVRQYQAIRSGGHVAVLDVYEGMPHGFPSFFADTPEGKTAYARAAAFFETNLKPGSGAE